MKKLKIYLLILTVIFNVCLSFGVVFGEEKDPAINLNKKEDIKPLDTPCIKKDDKTPRDSNIYCLLAPLPGLEDGIKTNDIGKYFNIIFNIAIGICGVLAVIMLIIHGISYMTSESFTEKAELKKKIWGPIGGLLLALGAYAILNTIDPALTGKDGLTVDQVEAQLNIEEKLALISAGYDINSDEIKKLSPEEIKKIKISYSGRYKAIKDEYIPARDKALPNVSKALRSLMTAHTYTEGFYSGSMSYRTKNPGNIGNVGKNDQGIAQKSTCYATLEDGIRKQYEHISNLVSGKNSMYKIGRKVNVIASAQRTPGESWIYDGSLWQYLYIYAPESPKKRDAYLSTVISYLASEGITITRDTKMSEIYGNTTGNVTKPIPVACN